MSTSQPSGASHARSPRLSGGNAAHKRRPLSAERKRALPYHGTAGSFGCAPAAWGAERFCLPDSMRDLIGGFATAMFEFRVCLKLLPVGYVVSPISAR